MSSVRSRSRSRSEKRTHRFPPQGPPSSACRVDLEEEVSVIPSEVPFFFQLCKGSVMYMAETDIGNGTYVCPGSRLLHHMDNEGKGGNIWLFSRHGYTDTMNTLAMKIIVTAIEIKGDDKTRFINKNGLTGFRDVGVLMSDDSVKLYRDEKGEEFWFVNKGPPKKKSSTGEKKRPKKTRSKRTRRR